MNNKIKATAMDSVVELNPKIKRSRSTFNLPIRVYTSFNIGELVPIDFTEVLPGDTFSVDLNSFIRLTSPAKRATMDLLHMDVFAFFVPYRFVDKSWVNIQGESSDPWYTAPGSCSTLTLDYSTTIAAGSLLNHLGVPIVTVDDDNAGIPINIYPIYSYYKIINDWFRDENLQAELAFDTSNGDYSLSDLPTINTYSAVQKGGLFKVAKYHDVFTSALPAPQKGPAVSLLKAEGKAPVGFVPVSSSTQASYVGYSGVPVGDSVVAKQFFQFKTTAMTDATNDGKGIVADVSQAYVTTINELRLAFQLQKAYELDARSGTRYTEALESRFSVKNPDLRLGRSELLGHYRFDLNMAEVASTSNQGLTIGSTLDALKGQSYSAGVGAGASKTGNSQHICVKTFLEHGLFMIVGCVRSDLTYQQGLEKFWRKTQRWDFYEPIFSNIGEVPIMKSELYFDLIADDDSANAWSADSVFGYQEAWYEYRYKQSKISGILASDANQGFDIFHYGQDFASAPTLGTTFLEQSPAALNRTLAFDSSTVDNFIGQFQGVIKATRVMPLFSVPGLIDHF